MADMSEENSSDSDEWFYDSFVRYKQLRMFELEKVVQQIELSDPRSICVLGEHKEGRHEILELSLPDKLTVAPSQEGLVKNSDLKMRSGGYTASPVVQMKTVWEQKKILVSEKEQTGVSIYNLGSEESDLISKVGSLTCNFVSPLMSVNKELVLLAGRARGDIALMDLNVNKTVHNLTVIEGGLSSWIEPSFLSESVAALCDKCSGSVLLYDYRMGKISGHIPCADWMAASDLWTMRSTADNRLSTGSDTRIGLASNGGLVVIHDIKFTNLPLCRGDVGRTCTVAPTINFSPDDVSMISLSGYDENVYIYDVSSSSVFKAVFIHDGHKKQNGSDRDSFVTSHMWYRDQTVVSASRNFTLQCWQFSQLS